MNKRPPEWVVFFSVILFKTHFIFLNDCGRIKSGDLYEEIHS